MNLKDDRLSKKVLNAEYKINGKWCHSVKEMFSDFDCVEQYETKSESDLNVT